MLLGIHPLLRGDVLLAVDRLGHGDTMLVADANFPAHRISATVIDIPGVDAPTVLEALLTVFPLDSYGEAPITLMSSAGDQVAGPDAADPMIDAFGKVCDGAAMVQLDRETYYKAAGAVEFIIRTGELRPYANVMLRKGVVNNA
jgi:L-fucose mutarotase